MGSAATLELFSCKYCLKWTLKSDINEHFCSPTCTFLLNLINGKCPFCDAPVTKEGVYHQYYVCRSCCRNCYGDEGSIVELTNCRYCKESDMGFLSIHEHFRSKKCYLLAKIFPEIEEDEPLTAQSLMADLRRRLEQNERSFHRYILDTQAEFELYHVPSIFDLPAQLTHYYRGRCREIMSARTDLFDQIKKSELAAGKRLPLNLNLNEVCLFDGAPRDGVDRWRLSNPVGRCMSPGICGLHGRCTWCIWH